MRQKRQWMNISVFVLATFLDLYFFFCVCQKKGGMCRAVSYCSHQRQTVVLCSSNALRPASLLLCYNGSVVDTCLSFESDCLKHQVYTTSIQTRLLATGNGMYHYIFISFLSQDHSLYVSIILYLTA